MLYGCGLCCDGRELNSIGTNVRSIQLWQVIILISFKSKKMRKKGQRRTRAHTMRRWKFSGDPFFAPGIITTRVRTKAAVDKNKDISGVYRWNRVPAARLILSVVLSSML
jgi:hypothetical protein